MPACTVQMFTTELLQVRVLLLCCLRSYFTHACCEYLSVRKHRNFTEFMKKCEIEFKMLSIVNLCASLVEVKVVWSQWKRGARRENKICIGGHHTEVWLPPLPPLCPDPGTGMGAPRLLGHSFFTCLGQKASMPVGTRVCPVQSAPSLLHPKKQPENAPQTQQNQRGST